MNNLLQFIVIVIITILIQIHDSSCLTDVQFANCSASYKCGDMEITYPFYGASGRPEYCGYPGFKATCANESVTTFDILSLTYRVLTIDSTLKMVTVVRDDYYNSYCPKYLYNTTLDYKLFGYGSNYQNLSLYYTCGTNTMATANQFTCSTNNTRTVATVVTGYYFTSTPTNIELTCSGLVLVPVFSTGANNLTSSPTLSNLQTVISEGFGLVWKANNSQCDACVGSGGQCGHRVGSGEFVCYCSDSDRAYGSECSSSAGTGTGTGSGKESSSSVLLIVGIILGTFATVGIASAVFFGIRQCKKKLIAESKSKGLRTTSYELDEFIRNYGSLAPKQYKYSDVKRITKSFANKLGQGGYGSVYKGKLSDGRPVAVKILNESKGNGEDFLNEVASISRTSHVNVVCLLGFCYKGTTKRALIYEFMSNSSLDKFIHREKASPNTNIELDRTSLLKIAVGIARGLEYLHSGCNTRILHLDIKPHNILLDEDWCPKIADFGLAKLCQKKDSMVSTMPARGTIGYIAPEVFNRAFGRVSYKSDVYSYGMMILEMAGVGKSAEIDGLTETSEMYFPNWIYKKLEGGPDGVALRDNEITGEDKDKEMERKMILVGLWCIQTKPTDRPSMARVIEMLEGSTDLLQTPPKPFLFPPTSRSPTRTYSSSSLSSTSQIIDIQS